MAEAKENDRSTRMRKAGQDILGGRLNSIHYGELSYFFSSSTEYRHPRNNTNDCENMHRRG